jgi:hypothetical protein
MPNLYKDPGKPLSPEQIESLAQSLDGASAERLYTARYEQHFLRKGLSAAEAKRKAQWWAQLKVSMPEGTVIDPDTTVDQIIAQHRAECISRGESVEPYPITGAQQYRGSFQPQTALMAPTMVRMEMPNLIGKRYAVNAFALSPAREYWAAASPGADFLATQEPHLFNSGALPTFTASALDPSILTQCHWTLRHSAAYAESKADVLEMVEASAVDRMDYEQDLDYAALQNQRGRDHLGDYLARAHAWAISQPAEPVTDAEIDEAWDAMGGYPGAPRQLPNTKK